jgi:hypothetical protein
LDEGYALQDEGIAQKNKRTKTQDESIIKL